MRERKSFPLTGLLVVIIAAVALTVTAVPPNPDGYSAHRVATPQESAMIAPAILANDDRPYTGSICGTTTIPSWSSGFTRVSANGRSMWKKRTHTMPQSFSAVGMGNKVAFKGSVPKIGNIYVLQVVKDSIMGHRQVSSCILPRPTNVMNLVRADSSS